MVPGRFPGNSFVWVFIKMLSRPPSEPEPSHSRVFVDPPPLACAPCTTTPAHLAPRFAYPTTGAYPTPALESCPLPGPG